MSTSTRTWRDNAWFAFFVVQIPIMLLVDLVPFYPTWMYVPPESPLHFLSRIRTWYKATYNDLFFTGPTPPWFDFFGAVEAVFLFPFVAWSLWRLSDFKRGTTGPQELATLLFAFWYAMTTATCLNDVFYWDEDAYPWEKKKVFLFQIYGPWFVLSECPCLCPPLVHFWCPR